MKKYYKYLLLLLCATAAGSWDAEAQYYYYGPGYYYVTPPPKTRLVDWQNSDANRYSISVHPFQLVNSGMRFDFEFELPQKGQWLQVNFSFYTRRWFTENDRGSYDYYYDDYYGDYYGGGWSNQLSGFDYFRKLGGVGLGVTYKYMFSPAGWYFNVGASVTYYDVHYVKGDYFPVKEGGLTYYEYCMGISNAKFVKPYVNVNIGKHIPFSKNIFMDLYCGVGYAYSIWTGYDRNSYDYTAMYGFARRGLTFSGGMRLGVLWSGRKVKPGLE